MVDSTDLRTTPEKPRRRSYTTGESLPALETEFRPIQLGRDSVGNPDSQIRAFAVAVLNRSDSTIYVKEGEKGDEIAVDRFESYDIWETNGVSSIQIRGENGGEQVTIRTLESHNDFSVTDKIDAFIRAVSHFLNSSKSETVITSTETNFDIGTINDGIDVDSINTDITVGTINDGISVDNGTISVDSIPAVTIGTINDGIEVDTITDGIDATIQNSSLTVDSVTGGIDANVTGNVVVDDITAANAEFDGDITGQTNFDLTAATREGRESVEYADISGVSIGEYDSQLGRTVPEYYNYLIRDNAAYDGRIERVEVRLFDDSGTPVNQVGFMIAVDSGDGTYDRVSPRACFQARNAFEYSSPAGEIYTPNYYPSGEVVLVWEPSNPPKFSAGDSVGIEVGPHGGTAGTGDISIEAEIVVTDIIKEPK